jgi:hypothetical protein
MARGGPVFLAVILLVALALGYAWTRFGTRPTARRGLLALGLSLAVVGVGVALERSGPRGAAVFPPFPDYYRGWLALDRLSGSQGSRVAYAGTNIPYYLFCKGLRNDVRYTNINAQRDWLMHDHHAAAIRAGAPNWPDPRPGWDRLEQDRAAWLANLRAAGIELLFVTRANPGEGRNNPDPADPLGFPVERRWADSLPGDFEPVYGAREGDPLVRIYRLRSP